jgi:hypothetical protein
MKSFKNVINKKIIKQLNLVLDSYKVKKSLWIFPGDNNLLENKVKSFIIKDTFLRNLINIRDAYIVFRIVNEEDKSRSLEGHFDNYLNTYYIPLKLPTKRNPRNFRGEMYFWKNARLMPNSNFRHIFDKFLFQNILSRKLIPILFKKNFKYAEPEIGDMLFFNGFTTLHYNTPTLSQHRSLVIHTIMPFGRSLFEKLIDSYSRFRVKK